ncbi:hypothetical protein F5Y14DRAFT_38893 [Nemania sp. NC0429]|nr:hypothetical protein F5Y14DRAFT_38893 [Nemania sp. NC0429]
MNTASSSRLRLEAVLRTTSTRPGAVVTTEATRGAPRGIEPTTTTTTPATPSPSPSPSPSRPPSPSPSIPTPSSISSNDEERRSADGDARLRAPSASVKIDWAEMATTSPALQEMLQIIGRRQQQQAEDGEEPAELEQDEQEEEEEEDPDAEAEAEEEQQEEQERQREQQREQDRPSLVEPGPPPVCSRIFISPQSAFHQLHQITLAALRQVGRRTADHPVNRIYSMIRTRRSGQSRPNSNPKNNDENNANNNHYKNNHNHNHNEYPHLKTSFEPIVTNCRLNCRLIHLTRHLRNTHNTTNTTNITNITNITSIISDTNYQRNHSYNHNRTYKRNHIISISNIKLPWANPRKYCRPTIP